jgi:acylphosphatase
LSRLSLRDESPMSTERRRVLYSGRVQGVGFRFTAQRLARERSVVGYIRNLPDDRVELVGEGTPEVLDDFLRAIRTAMGDKIRDVSVSKVTGGQAPLSDFSIVS